MKIEYDNNKSDKNSKERNLSFDDAINFEWDTAIYEEDTRKLYPEKRIISMGFLNKRVHVICFTETNEGIRVISFRKANKREVTRYEKETTNK